jgi:protein-L-isoaspartate(D-aspartate) O-methyltransferase
MMKKLLLLTLIAVVPEAMAADAQCVPERAAMVETIRAYARSDVAVLGPQGISESVLKSMEQTERHRFIPASSCSVAYADMPVPIGQGQTISQPFVVAMMTHLAVVKSDHAVLEVGTGSGYQAAVLARLVRRVCTIEIVPALGEVAARVLEGLGYDNVSVKVGDGYYGWPRGNVTIMNRRGLVHPLCECYGISKREFDRLLGGRATRKVRPGSGPTEL